MDTRSLPDSTVLVTGGAGFIGSHLCERLLTMGANVVCVDNLFTGKLENIEAARRSNRFEFCDVDINDAASLRSVFLRTRPDFVYHYAAVLGVKRVMEDPLLVLSDIDGTRNVLSISKETGVRKVVYASSSEAYGESGMIPLTEDSESLANHTPNSQNMYAVVKLLGEKMMRVYDRMYNLPTCSLRFFNVYGPRQETSAYGFVVGVFIDQALSGGPLTVFGDGYQTRDFVYVADNVDMGLRALLSDAANGETINVGVGRQTTIRDLAERVVNIAGGGIEIVNKPARPYEVRYRAPDVSKMRSLLGDVSDRFDERLRATLEYYRERERQLVEA